MPATVTTLRNYTEILAPDLFDVVKEEVSVLSLATSTGASQMKNGASSFFINPSPCCGHNNCFSVNVARNRWKCFSCGSGGSVIDLAIAMRMANEPYDAAKILAERNGIDTHIEVSPERIEKINKLKRRQEVFDAATEYYVNGLKKNQRALKYLKEKRKRSDEMIEKMRYGFSSKKGSLYKHLRDKGFSDGDALDSGLCRLRKDSNQFYDLFWDDRLIYPIFLYGKPVDFLSKAIFKDKSEDYYELRLPIAHRIQSAIFYNQDDAFRDNLIIVEGPEDVNSVLQAGDFHVIGTRGQVSEDQIALLQKSCKEKRVFLCLDNDGNEEAGGVAFRNKLINALSDIAIVSVIQFPDDFKDIDDYLKSVDNPGKELQQLMDESEDAISFRIKLLPTESEMDPKKREKPYREVFELIARQKVEQTRDGYCKLFAKHAGTETKMLASVRRAVREILTGKSESEEDEGSSRYGTIEKSGLKYIRHSKESTKVISNFILDIQCFVLDGKSRIYKVRLQNTDGIWSREFDMVGEERVNPHIFGARASDQGSYYFSGNSEDLIQIWLMEEKNTTSDNVISYHQRYGFIKDDNLWLFSNCAYRDGRLYKANDEGQIIIDSVGYQSKDVNVYSGDAPQLYLDEKPSHEYVKKVVMDFWSMCDSTQDSLASPHKTFRGFLILGFIATTVYLPEITKAFRKFPFVALWGPSGTGKSEVIQLLMNIFGFRQPGESWDGATIAGTSMVVSQLSSIPYWLEEFANAPASNTRQRKMIAVLKNIYNRASYSVGGLKNTRQTREVLSSIVITGQARPAEQALLSRCIILQKENYTDPGSEAYNRLRKDREKLSLVLRWLIENKTKERVNELMLSIKEFMDYIERRCEAHGHNVDARTLENLSIIAAGFWLFEIHDFDKGFKEWLVDQAKEDVERKGYEDVLFRFFEDIDTMFSADIDNVAIFEGQSTLHLRYNYVYDEWIRRHTIEFLEKNSILEYLKTNHRALIHRSAQKWFWIYDNITKQKKRKQQRCITINIQKLPEKIQEIILGWRGYDGTCETNDSE